MRISDAERLLAMEAAMDELSRYQLVAARYRELRGAGDRLYGRLADMGRKMREAARHGPLTDELAATIEADVLAVRGEWQRRFADLRRSAPYLAAVAACAADDQEAIVRLIPRLFAEVAPEQARWPLYREIELAPRKRSGSSPFRTPEAVVEEVLQARDGGLVAPPAAAGEWWEADFPRLSFFDNPAGLDSPVALVVDRPSKEVALFREGDAIVAFTPCLRAHTAVAVAESSDDSWWNAVEGSFEGYRLSLLAALEAADVPVIGGG